MTHAVTENGVAALEFSRRALLGFLEDIPEDKLAYQPFPGANHALWVMGHLAWSDNVFLAQLGGGENTFSEAWEKRFAWGSTPQADAGVYPAPAELRDRLAERRASLVNWFRSLDEQQLAAPLPEEFADFAPNHGALLATIAWHEGLHSGQVSAIRKALGLKPKFA